MFDKGVVVVTKVSELVALTRELRTPSWSRPQLSLRIDTFGQGLGDAGVVAFAQALAALRSFDAFTVLELDLRRNRISDGGCMVLFESLGRLPKLSSLSLQLEGNHIGPGSAAALATPLQSWHGSSLQHLTLHFGDSLLPGCELSDFTESMGALERLTSLELSLRTDSQGLDDAARELARLSSLKSLHLDISGSTIGTVRPLAGALKQLAASASLANLGLDLWGIEIGDAGAHDLATGIVALRSSLTVMSLRLGSCSIYPEGGRFLALALRRLRLVWNLSLVVGSNHIGDLGVQNLAEAVGKLTCLTSVKLDVSGNEVKYPGAAALAKAFQRLPMLAVLVLNASTNLLREDGVATLAESLDAMEELRALDLNLRNNTVGDVGARALAVAVAAVVTSGRHSIVEAKLLLSADSFGKGGALALTEAGRTMRAGKNAAHLDLRYFNDRKSLNEHCLKVAATAEWLPRGRVRRHSKLR